MRNFTPEEMEILSKFEDGLRTAFKFGFKHPSPAADSDIVAKITEDATGRKFQHNWSCSHCLYTVWKEAGRIYFKTLEESAQQDSKESRESAQKTDNEPKLSLLERLAKARAALAEKRAGDRNEKLNG